MALGLITLQNTFIHNYSADFKERDHRGAENVMFPTSAGTDDLQDHL